MKAEFIPLLVVQDVLANVEYLEHSLGFRLDHAADDKELAVMKYRGATVMIQSRKAYAADRGVAPEKYVPGEGIELLIQVDDFEETYAYAMNNNAKVIRHTKNTAESSEPNISRFSIALPDEHVITFFDYGGNHTKSAQDGD